MGGIENGIRETKYRTDLRLKTKHCDMKSFQTNCISKYCEEKGGGSGTNKSPSRSYMFTKYHIPRHQYVTDTSWLSSKLIVFCCTYLELVRIYGRIGLSTNIPNPSRPSEVMFSIASAAKYKGDNGGNDINSYKYRIGVKSFNS